MHSVSIHAHWLIVQSDNCYDTDWIFRSTSSEVGQTSYTMMWRILQYEHNSHHIKSLRTHMQPDGCIRIGYNHIWSVPISGFGCDCICYNLIDVSHTLIQRHFQEPFYITLRGRLLFAYLWALVVVVIGVDVICVFCIVVWRCGWTASYQAFSVWVYVILSTRPPLWRVTK